LKTPEGVIRRGTSEGVIRRGNQKGYIRRGTSEGVIRRGASKMDRQYNGQKKKDKRTNTIKPIMI
jgi:hypothetical protein